MRQIKFISLVLRGFCVNPLTVRGTAVAQWLRCCATKQKVAGSIPDGVIVIFISHKVMALVSTQPVTEMSTRIISWR